MRMNSGLLRKMPLEYQEYYETLNWVKTEIIQTGDLIEYHFALEDNPYAKKVTAYVISTGVTLGPFYWV